MSPICSRGCVPMPTSIRCGECAVADLPITLADVIVVLVLLISALLAFARGFVHEVLAVGGWVGAVVVTIYGLPWVRPYARMLVDDPTLADVGAGLVLFVASLIVLSLVTGALSHRVRDSQLNALDRSLGFLFGLARGAVLLIIVYVALEWLMPEPKQPPWIREARSMPLIEAGAEAFKSFIPAAQTERAGAAVPDAADDPRNALETNRMLRDMMTPEPRRSTGDGSSGETGYSPQERRDFERLLESSQGRN